MDSVLEWTNERLKRDEQEERQNEMNAMIVWFAKNCPTLPDQCKTIPKESEERCYNNAVIVILDIAKTVSGTGSFTTCNMLAEEGFKVYCKTASHVLGCSKFHPPPTPKPTTSTTTSTTTTLPTTTVTNNNTPFIIGGIIGVVALIAVRVGIFIYCRRKRKASIGKRQSKTGTMTGGTTVTGATRTGRTKTGSTTTTGGKKTKTGGTTTRTNTGARY